MRKLLVGVVVVVVVAIVAVYMTTRGDRTESRPEASASAAGSALTVGNTRGRDATIPVGRIVRDAKRRVPDDARPTKDPVLAMIIPPEFRSPACPECPQPPAAVIEGALAGMEVFDHYFGLSQWLQPNLMNPVTMPRYDRCKTEFLARGGVIERDLNWMIALHVVSDGRQAHVVEVLAPPEFWPAALDAEARECWLRIFAEIQWPAKEIVDVVFEYPLSIGPPEPKTTPTTPR